VTVSNELNDDDEHEEIDGVADNDNDDSDDGDESGTDDDSDDDGASRENDDSEDDRHDDGDDSENESEDDDDDDDVDEEGEGGEDDEDDDKSDEEGDQDKHEEYVKRNENTSKKKQGMPEFEDAREVYVVPADYDSGKVNEMYPRQIWEEQIRDGKLKFLVAWCPSWTTQIKSLRSNMANPDKPTESKKIGGRCAELHHWRDSWEDAAEWQKDEGVASVVKAWRSRRKQKHKKV
jgi:hypothetical protein